MRGPDRLFAALFALLRSGLAERPLTETEYPAVAALNAGDWGFLAQLAREQSVEGVVYRALTHLPETVQVPGDVVFSLMARAEGIKLRNRKKDAVSARLMAHFRADGLSPLIMKGSAVAAFYPVPTLRESGDLDFYFPDGQLARAQACLQTAGTAADGSGNTTETAADGSVQTRVDGVEIDLHDRYFDLPDAAEKLPAPGTPEATLLMLSAHILKHAAGPGVGLRPLCDMAMACRSLAGRYDPADLWELFRRTGILRWNLLLFSFLTEYLGLDEAKVSAAGYWKRVNTSPLLRIILQGGHFGHYARSRRTALGKGGLRRKFDTFFRFLRRLPFSLRYAPRATFSTLHTLLKGNLTTNSGN